MLADNMSLQIVNSGQSTTFFNIYKKFTTGCAGKLMCENIPALDSR